MSEDCTGKRLLLTSVEGMAKGLKYGLITPEMLEDALFAFFYRTHLLNEVKATLEGVLPQSVATEAYLNQIVEIVRQAILQKRVTLCYTRTKIYELNYLLSNNGYNQVVLSKHADELEIAEAIGATNPSLLTFWQPDRMPEGTIKELYSRRGMDQQIILTVQHTEQNQEGYYPILYRHGETPKTFGERLFGQDVAFIHLNGALLTRDMGLLSKKDVAVITLQKWDPDYSLSDVLRTFDGQIVWVKTESLSLVESVQVVEPGLAILPLGRLNLRSVDMKALIIDGVVLSPNNYLDLWLRPGQKVTIVVR